MAARSGSSCWRRCASLHRAGSVPLPRRLPPRRPGQPRRHRGRGPPGVRFGRPWDPAPRLHRPPVLQHLPVALAGLRAHPPRGGHRCRAGARSSPCGIVITFVLADLSYRLIETPDPPRGHRSVGGGWRPARAPSGPARPAACSWSGLSARSLLLLTGPWSAPSRRPATSRRACGPVRPPATHRPYQVPARHRRCAAADGRRPRRRARRVRAVVGTLPPVETTTTVILPPIPVIAIGDSVMLGAAPKLLEALGSAHLRGRRRLPAVQGRHVHRAAARRPGPPRSWRRAAPRQQRADVGRDVPLRHGPARRRPTGGGRQRAGHQAVGARRQPGAGRAGAHLPECPPARLVGRERHARRLVLRGQDPPQPRWRDRLRHARHRGLGDRPAAPRPPRPRRRPSPRPSLPRPPRGSRPRWPPPPRAPPPRRSHQLRRGDGSRPARLRSPSCPNLFASPSPEPPARSATACCSASRPARCSAPTSP